ncbi:predicted protein [Uncinocarpus reesii 1704]|uniref:Uncharacterized protein n=1 Tax=Uncinocarpus reesii (strain UAMH 1704) TaxID=336963 RepID=C4JEX0_UNCRE|nr:uncharacterized protein UREG_00870 [Uncinocarpus reesii 1704]EEP76023.1 predicted protein [Uncinocarpus reesii 1704]
MKASTIIMLLSLGARVIATASCKCSGSGADVDEHTKECCGRYPPFCEASYSDSTKKGNSGASRFGIGKLFCKGNTDLELRGACPMLASHPGFTLPLPMTRIAPSLREVSTLNESNVYRLGTLTGNCPNSNPTMLEYYTDPGCKNRAGGYAFKDHQDRLRTPPQHGGSVKVTCLW